MRHLIIALAAFVLGITFGGPALTSAWAQVAAISIYQATLVEPDQKTGEISTEALSQVLASGGGLVYDSRPPLQYAIGHIPGAVSGPKPGIQPATAAHVAGIQELVPDKDSAIILYCNGVF